MYWLQLEFPPQYNSWFYPDIQPTLGDNILSLASNSIIEKGNETINSGKGSINCSETHKRSSSRKKEREDNGAVLILRDNAHRRTQNLELLWSRVSETDGNCDIDHLGFELIQSGFFWLPYGKQLNLLTINCFLFMQEIYVQIVIRKVKKLLWTFQVLYQERFSTFSTC